MQAFAIPVAFLVEGEDEDDAASRLVHRIESEFTGGSERGPQAGAIESWWLPNHPPYTHGGDLDMPRLHWSDQSTIKFLMDKVTNANGTRNLTEEEKDDIIDEMNDGAWHFINAASEDVHDILHDKGFIKYED